VTEKGDRREMNSQYEVLSPWAEADPISYRGLTAIRLTDLAGKKIGLFASSKPISKRIMIAFEKKLKDRFPTCETRWYIGEGSWAVLQTETQNREKYKAWVNGVDAVVAAVGD
jgi:hypothetical protein